MSTDKKKIPPVYNKVFPFLLLVATLVMGVGYAAINSISLSIGGSFVALAQDGIYITEVVYDSNSDADISSSSIKSYHKTMLGSNVVLSSSNADSYITYTVSIYNETNSDYMFAGVTYDKEFYSNENITYSLSGLRVTDVVKAKDTITFNITYKYVDGVVPSASINTLESYLNFKFVKFVSTDQPGGFGYTGGVVEFVSSEKSKYFVQVWGAQGGSASGSKNGTYSGGKGGYSEGFIDLEAGEKIYIIVGGQGASLNQDDYLNADGTYTPQGVVSGGFNGGGNSYSNTKGYMEASGGGATHMAKTNRFELFNYVDYKDEVIIVAGGGGGSNYENASWNCSSGGAGGGLESPNISHGGNGTSYGASTTSEKAGTGGSFGQGANGADYTNKLLPGGGGGYYGGGFVTKTDGAINSNKGSSGGSGYIGGVYDGVSTAGNLSIPTHDGTSVMTGNVGDGYAKITFIEKIVE